MRVLVGKRLYRMTRAEYDKLLQMASDLIPRGIFAIEKHNYAELKNETYELHSDLREAVRVYKYNDFKVHANGL